MSGLIELTMVFIAVMLTLYVVLRVSNRLEQRHQALMSAPSAGSADAQFASALAQAFAVHFNQERATAMVAALAAAIEFGKNDWIGGLGNETSKRAYSNAQHMLRKAQASLDANEHIAAQEFARLGQDLLKAAYTRAHS